MIRSKTVLVLCLGLGPLGLHAQGPVSPGYYRVAGVSAGDVLNVRAEPGVTSPRVDALAAGEAPIEVIEVRPRSGAAWGMVATGEGSGWVSMRYLEPIELEGVLGSAVPVDALCSGTEPFWGLSFEQDTAVFEDAFAELRSRRFPVEHASPAVGRFHPVLLSFAEQGGYAVVDRGLCSDGMSDIPYGWSVHLIMSPEAPADPARLLSGCCRVRPSRVRPDTEGPEQAPEAEEGRSETLRRGEQAADAEPLRP